MYNPAPFGETRPQILRQAIADYPLATLVTLGSRGIDANHIPMLHFQAETDGAGVLRGHVARTNPQWQEYLSDTEALAIFMGPQHYVTPNWYPSKAEHGAVVPTWNYLTVHARGTLTFHTDAEWVFNIVRDLTDAQERSSATPWRVPDAPKDYVDKLLGAIVGVELRITRLEGKWKLSQNRSTADRDGVIAGLEERDSSEARDMAQIMKRGRLG